MIKNITNQSIINLLNSDPNKPFEDYYLEVPVIVYQKWNGFFCEFFNTESYKIVESVDFLSNLFSIYDNYDKKEAVNFLQNPSNKDKVNSTIEFLLTNV
jgi:hypothetical protein